MIVDDLRIEDRDGATVERSARVRWSGGEWRLRFEAPAGLADRLGSGSPFLSACLLQAMARHEDLEVDGPVSPTLLAATDRIQTIYRSWAPELRRAAISVAGETGTARPAPGLGCFFSRGVDSMYSAATEGGGRLTHLVFIADLDPINDPATRAEEVRLSEEAASLLGLPLVVAATNVRPMADRLIDWSDLLGGGLSALAQCLAGGLGAMLIPSGADWATFGPSGSSPVLDPLFSTETMSIEHGAMGEGRHGKVAWLARERPDLLPLIKVCFAENRPDNCGRCRKCLWTMTCLEAVDALEQATSFPSEIDVRLIREMRPPALSNLLSWLDAADALALSGRAPEVERAIRHALDRTARPSLVERTRARWTRLRGGTPKHDPNRSGTAVLFHRRQTDAALAVLRSERGTVIGSPASSTRTRLGSRV